MWIVQRKNTLEARIMIEILNFLKWIGRKIMSAPSRLHEWLTGLCMDKCAPGGPIGGGIFVMVLGSLAIIAILVLLAKFYLTVVGQLPEDLFGILWYLCEAFLISTGVRAMYRSFKIEQAELFDALRKKD